MRKRCTRCGLSKLWEDYYAAAKRDDGTMRRPQSRCKRCVREVAEVMREKWDRGYHARRREDPERHAVHLLQRREHFRRKTGSTVGEGLRRSPSDAVESAAIREEWEASGAGYSEVATRTGLDEAAIRRALRGERMSVRTATAILDAIGSSPVEVGL